MGRGPARSTVGTPITYLFTWPKVQVQPLQ